MIWKHKFSSICCLEQDNGTVLFEGYKGRVKTVLTKILQNFICSILRVVLKTNRKNKVKREREIKNFYAIAVIFLKVTRVRTICET